VTDEHLLDLLILSVVL